VKISNTGEDSQIKIFEPSVEVMTDQSAKQRILLFAKKYKVIDYVIFLSILGTIGLTAFGVIPPWSDGGIYCDDPSINFKFQGDTVPTIWLFIGLLIPPLLVIYITELLDVSSQVSNSVSPNNPPIQQNANDSQQNQQSAEHQQQPKQYSVQKLALKSTKAYYGSLLNGLLFGALLTEVLKTLVAEPRPHFLDTCKPTNLNCTEKGQFIRYHDIVCSDTNSPRNGVPRAIFDAKKSFPSGHALLSTYSAIFMVVFAQRKIGTAYSTLWKHLLQMVFICFALLCSISRIIDKRHHWWDVLAGVIGGISLAVITVKWHVNDFKCDKSKRQNYSPDEPDAELPILNSTSGVENPTSGSENFNDIRFRGSSTTVESTAET